MKKESKSRSLALTAMLAALAVILGYIDAILPILDFLPMPGIKLGLANAAILLCLCFCHPLTAFAVSMIRILLVTMLFVPNPTALFYSLAGGVASFLVMLLLKKFGFHPIVLSIGGAVAHNLAQVAVGILMLSTPMLASYLLILIPLGIFTGALLGIPTTLILKRKQ